jgi:hypothetical protein
MDRVARPAEPDAPARLTAGERRRLAVLLDVIVPGAQQAGAASYLAGRVDPTGAAWLRRVLNDVADADSCARHVARLAGAPAGSDDAVAFLRLRQLAWESLLCDPSRGGNRNGAGWAAFGFTGRPKGGEQRGSGRA